MQTSTTRNHKLRPLQVRILVLAGFAATNMTLPANADVPNGTIHVDGRSFRNSVMDGTGGFPDALPLYHNGASLICADCHVMHSSQSHAYSPAGPRPGEEVPYSGAAGVGLLKSADPVDLCLSCHDGHSFAPDVLGADHNGMLQRSAGHFDEIDVENPRGHDLGRNLSTGGGFGLCMRCHFSSGLEVKVTCIDCHNPHGNNVARNLQWASDPAATPDLGLFVNPGASGLDRYQASNVAYGTLNSVNLREASNMCIDCHHVFSGGSYIDPNTDGIHERHPSYDSERSSPNNIAQGASDGTSDPAHWEDGTGSGFHTTPRLRFVVSGASNYGSAVPVDATTNGVFCLSCHYAHGSDQAFGLRWTPQPVGYPAAGCDQCHNTADTPPPSP